MTSSAPHETLRQALATAIAARQSGHLEAALAAGRELLALLPDDPTLHQFIGEVAIGLGDAVAPFLPDAAWPLVAPEPPHATVFGCLAHPSRLNRSIFALWRGILDTALGATLLLAHPAYADPEVADHWRAGLESAGLATRTEIRGLGTTWGMEVYDEVTIILDTFPVSGATTSLIALWMGVPVISLYGRYSWQRFGLAILATLGLDYLTASSPADYVAASCRLALDKDRLVALRASLRENMRHSPLCDGPARTRELEATLIGLLAERTGG